MKHALTPPIRHWHPIAWLLLCLGLGLGLGLDPAPAQAQAQAQPEKFENTMAERLRSCTVCHGAQGRASPNGYYPRLAGKPEAYLYNQLTHFREGRRHHRLMQGLLSTLSDDYLHEIARHFATLSVPYPAPNPPPMSPAMRALGQKLTTQGDPARALPACTQCHGAALTGKQPHVPGLLGLPHGYLIAQLGGWKTGQRQSHAPDCMRSIATKLQDPEIYALAYWLASQPVPAHSAPESANMVPPPAPAPHIACGSAPTHARPTATENTAEKTANNGTNNVSRNKAKSTPNNTPRSTKDNPQNNTPPSTALPTLSPAHAQVQRGAYLARIGNCAQCHTAPGGRPYAGARSIQTPFGTIFSSNLTADATHGLGAWTQQDFWNALHEGKSKNGRLLYPAFPYTSYTHITRSDANALFAYFQSLAPVAQPNQPHQLSWPAKTTLGLWAWRWLFFSPAATEPPLERGEYLVRGLAHCNECHLPRNALGASQHKSLRDASMPDSAWVSPSLDPRNPNAASHWSEAELVRLLKTGVSPHGYAQGPMAEVVLHSTQYLEESDAQAIAKYLRRANTAAPTPKPVPTATAQAPNPNPNPKANVNALHPGARLYTQHCSQCHGVNGQGQAGAYPALAGNPRVTQANTQNLIQTLLYGGYPAATAGNPRPFGMPAFVLHLNDAQSAAVLSFVRSAWGNTAAPVATIDITQAKK
jgi:cytochrome c553